MTSAHPPTQEPGNEKPTPNNWPAEAAARIAAYLTDRGRNLLAPALKPAVSIRASTWRAWFTGERRKDTGAGIPPPVAAVAVAVIDELPLIGDRFGDHVVDRTTLARLSAVAGDGEDDLLRLWVTTMMWGWAGRRGPWRTAEGLADERLIGCLRDTADLVAAGDLAGAHRRFALRGAGEPFFTKWFWAISIGSDQLGPRPLILDSRVRTGLAALGWQWPRVPPGERYVTYVNAAHAIAGWLDPERGIDPEQVEGLLFERGLGSLHTWLREER